MKQRKQGRYFTKQKDKGILFRVAENRATYLEKRGKSFQTVLSAVIREYVSEENGNMRILLRTRRGSDEVLMRLLISVTVTDITDSSYKR